MNKSDNLLPNYPCKEDLWDSLAKESRPIVVYGMGNGADKLIRRFEKYNIEIADFFASDGFVRGHSFHGKRVKSFSEIKESYSDFVIVLSFASNRSEVIEMLREIDSKYEMVIPDMPVADENEYFDREFYNRNYEEIVKAYNSLADEKSKMIFTEVIKYKLDGKLSHLLLAFSQRDEKYEMLSQRNIFALVDVGAYNGDTLREAIQYFPDLKKAYAIEPDAKNFKKLKKYADNIEQIEIKTINAAAWSECEVGGFSLSGNRNSSVCSTASYENKSVEVELISIDSIVDEQVDYIKYDVEGAEYEALVGSKNTILKYRPSLSVSLYHKSRDIFFLVNFLREEYPDYSFYIKRLLCVPAWEIDLVMIPKNI